MTAHGLHQYAGLPISNVRYVDWYFNADGVQTRLEQGEYNGDLLNLYHEKMQRLNPGLLEAYVAARTRPDRRFSWRQIEHMSVGTQPQLNAARRDSCSVRLSARLGRRTRLAIKK